ncbi:hypothetical protein GH714_000861 [Hevea brasiliensis]|uniref:Patatin n=1 Tax=Hevea brasiliensis TaxID=3981 RepID=A0A6A6LVH5_HEVBR|nr:hypothetical protein GH714_000861 [Hevea brasiliensis]
MSWGLGWKRPSEIFRLTLNYGTEESEDDLNRMSTSSSSGSFSSSSPSSPLSPPRDQELGFRIDLDWTSAEDEDQVALRLQSHLMVALPLPQDCVTVDLKSREEEEGQEGNVGLEMNVVKRREPLRGMTMSKDGSGQQSDGLVELSQCVGLVELSLEHNKLVRPLLDFRIVADENLRSVNVQIETQAECLLLSFISFFSCHHPLLASALAKIMQDQGNRVVVGKDENAMRQLISMISSDNQHVVKQACSTLLTLAGDVPFAIQLMKCDIMQPIEIVLKSGAHEEVISVLQVVATLAFTSDTVAQKILTKELLKSLKLLCAHKNPEVQRLALLAVGNLAFCLENRCVLVTSESLRDLLLRLTVISEPRVNKAAARALAILGENENLRRAIRGRQVAKQGLRILSMDGGGMKGLATVQILKAIEKGTGKRIHELFDLICGTSTGGMLAVALGIKLMTLGQCEEIYKNLGKLVFAEPTPKDNEAASWREKLDQLYKSSSQSFRVVVHGSKYPAGTPEVPFAISETSGVTVLGSPTTGAQVGYKRSAFIGSCKHHVWQAIRASSAAPYYLDDFSDDINRWQDGAIVANNTTIFAIREAQLLWPDTKIDCLVSIGCGSVPTKARKGGWRYLDTGQVLIESSCSVDRVEEALSTLLPLLPEIQYFRFNPVDERCDMELDETDPAVWLKLEAAVEDYIQTNPEAFKNVCERLLLPYQHDDKLSQNLKNQQFQNAKLNLKIFWLSAILDENRLSLGWRRNVLLVESLHSLDSGRVVHHARELESFCGRNVIRFSLNLGASGIAKTVPATTFPSPFTSPLITGRFPSSPLSYSPDFGPQKNDVFVVAEPGDLADKFLQSVKFSFLSMMRGHHRKVTSFLANISTVSDLVRYRPYFQVGNVVHRYIGRQTQVMEDDQEIGAYMFRRTVPAMHLTPDDVRLMVGAWRDRIVICIGTYGPTSTLIKAFLDSGAKAVICPSADPPEIPVTSAHGSGKFHALENGRFEIGEEDTEDEEAEPVSPTSDWEDSDLEKNGEHSMGFWEDDEEELSRTFLTAAATSIIPFPYTTATLPLQPLHYSPSPHSPPLFFSPLSKWIAPFQSQGRGPLFLSSPPWKLLQSATPLYLRGNAVVLRKVEALNLNLLRTRISSGLTGQRVLDRVQELKEGVVDDRMITNEMYSSAFVGLVLSGSTDWLDGYIARKMRINSVVGSYLDPLADKVLIGSVALAMVHMDLLHPGLVGLVVLRDVALVGGALYHRATSLDWKLSSWHDFFNLDGTHREKVEPLFISKVNTVFQLILVAAALLQPEFGTDETQSCITYLSWLVAATTVASTAGYGAQYMRNKSTLLAKKS